MKTASPTGIPLAMRQDGWWLDDAPAPRMTGQSGRKRDVIKGGLLVALIALGDLLVWHVVPGVSLALLGFAVIMAGLAVAWPRLPVRVRVGISAGSVLCVLPLVELVQPLSVLIAFAGMLVLCVALAGVQAAALIRGAVRLVWLGPLQSLRDAVLGVRGLKSVGVPQADMRALLMGWALPVGATFIFGLLLIGANPVLDRALSQLAQWQMPAPDLWRLWFWAILGTAIWPVLVARRMHERLRGRRAMRATVKRQGIVNAGSVARSLVAFNALFAVQTGMDVMFLYAETGLPESISPAAYAHRGAYPLLVTALLAGLFAVLARPYLGERPVVRILMLFWLGQTLALVFASLWRLEAYVDIYGLTRLRVAAYLWMGLVAAGLGLVVVQIWQDRPARWMLARSGMMGALVLYICAFVNFDGVIAQHNLTQDVTRDHLALCKLSEGALPAMTKAWNVDARAYCRENYHRAPGMFTPSDWREWGFRNWRVRRSLAAMTHTPSEIAVP